MKVFLAGSTGFVGHEVLNQLLAAGHTVRCLIRAGSEKKLPIRQDLEVRKGDVTDPASLEGALEGCDAAINLVGIIREFPSRGITFAKLHAEGTRRLVEAARAQSVGRFLQMSANGAGAQASTAYFATKWQAEEAVRASDLQWTIFRPSIIFGPGGEFVEMLTDMVKKLPVVPVVGNGKYRMSPVSVGEVATGFVKALTLEASIGHTYSCCGPESYSFNEILDLVGRAMGKKRVRKLPQPVFLLKPVVSLLEGLPAFPLSSSQMTMLLEGNVCDPGTWSETFGIDPVSFAQGIGTILKK